MPLNFVAKAAITVGMMAANMALTMTRKIEGPRLDDTRFNSGDYGAPIPFIWGKRRVTPPIFWGEDLREVKRRRKTKGGKYNEYTYFGTWAVALADHEIAGISRIWFDTHLVFDLTGAGPVTPFDFGDRGIAKDPDGPLGIGYGGTNYGDAVALYLGTETQEPDPRMQASVEAANGEGSCPAYRGVSYIVFKDIPLEKLGNRIPQVSVEVMTSSTGTIPTDERATNSFPNYRNWKFSGDYARLAWVDNDTFEIWDVAARAQMVAWTLDVDVQNSFPMGVYTDGGALVINSSGDEIWGLTPDGAAAVFFDNGLHHQGVYVLKDGRGDEHWATRCGEALTWYFNGTEYTNGAWFPYHYFVDGYGDVWGIGSEPGGTATTVYFQRFVASGDGIGWPSLIEVTGLPASDEAFGSHVQRDGEDFFLLRWGGVHYRIDPVDGSVIDSVAAPSGGGLGGDSAWINLSPGAPTIWLGNSEYDLVTGDLLRTVSTGYLDTTYGAVYDPINHAITYALSDPALAWAFLDRVTGDGVTLQSVAESVADRCNVEDYDFSALNQLIDGWSATQGDGQNMVEPLLDAYDSDIRPHDFSVQGIKRSGVSGGTILTEQFLEASPRYTVPIKQSDQLPRSLLVSFADTTADQQVSNLRAGRPLDSTGARGEQNIDLGTLALDPDTARGLGERYFRRMWSGRKEPANGLTAQYLALEPGDVRTLDLDGKTMIAQLRKLTVSADDSLRSEWRYDHPSLAVLDGAEGATQDGRTPAEIVVPLISKGFVLDVPLLTDADNDNNPLLYVAAGPYADGAWPGATIFEGVDGEFSDEFAGINGTARATWGYATEAVGDADPWLWDRGNSVNVMLRVGTLTGCTEADIDANPRLNLCFLGGEVLNFTTATLEGDGSYTLSGFKRGRRGTEWACGDHTANDVFLLLDTAEGVETGLSDVGTDLTFKAVTNGRTAAGAFPIDLEPFTGASLKPYAPCHLEAELDSGSGDWDLSWVRRTRVGGAWTSGTTIPLSEASEAYKVRIYDGATLKRTFTLTDITENGDGGSVIYSAADQTTDFGAPLSSAPEWTVVQVSDAVGDGFVAQYA